MTDRNFYTTSGSTDNPLSDHTTSHAKSNQFSSDPGGGVYQRHRDDDSRLVWCGMGIYVLLTMWEVVSEVGCFIWGVIGLVEDYDHIPNCASCYKGWSIAMTVIFGVAAFRSRDSKSGESGGTVDEITSGMVASVAGLVALITGLISGLGYRKVWKKPLATCDLSGMHSLKVWSDAIIIYYGVLTMIAVLVMVVAGFYSHCRRRAPSQTVL